MAYIATTAGSARQKYAMVRDLLRLLNNGHVVYTNFTINWNGYDQ